jgi:hypothetical protein
MRRQGVLLLAAVVFCCLGVFLSLLATTAAASSSEVAEVPSALAGANNDVVHVNRGETNDTAPVPDRSYLPLLYAEELQETDGSPVNASVLTMVVLAISSFGASFLWLLTTNARRRAAICSSGVEEDRSWLAAVHEGPFLLGVFLL